MSGILFGDRNDEYFDGDYATDDSNDYGQEPGSDEDYDTINNNDDGGEYPTVGVDIYIDHDRVTNATARP